MRRNRSSVDTHETSEERPMQRTHGETRATLRVRRLIQLLLLSSPTRRSGALTTDEMDMAIGVQLQTASRVVARRER